MPRINDRYRIIESDWTPYVTVTLNDTTTDETTTTVTGTNTGTYWTYNTLNDNRITINSHDYWYEVPSNNSNGYITLDPNLSFNSNSLWSDSRSYVSWDPGLSFEESYKRWLKRRNKKRVIRI